MKVLVATNLTDVRELVADACESVSNCSTENVGTTRALELGLSDGSAQSDIIFFDASLPEYRDPIDHISALRDATPARLVVLMPPKSNGDTTRRYIARGADAVLHRTVEADQVADVLRLVRDGFSTVALPIESITRAEPPKENLSERELQVLTGICQGMQNKEIAHGFKIKEVTVKMHVRAIIRKLGANNRTHAAMIARDLGLIC